MVRGLRPGGQTKDRRCRHDRVWRSRVSSRAHRICDHREVPRHYSDLADPDRRQLMAAREKVTVDWPLVASALLLSLYGIAIVYSAGQTDIPTFVARAWKAQVGWFVLGLAGAYAISRASV